MPNSSTLADGVLDYAVGRNGTLGSGLTRYMRLWLSLPTLSGSGGTEVSGTGYGAYLIFPALVFNTAATGGSISNDGELNWGTAGSDWGTVVGVTLESSTSGGTFYRSILFTTAVGIDDGESFRIPVGQLQLTQV